VEDRRPAGESIHRGVAAFALLIGVGALLFPRTLFAHSYATRSLPRRTSIMALASAGAVALLSALARSQG